MKLIYFVYMTIIAFFLKAGGVIPELSWWAVFAPLWIPITFIFLLFSIAFLFTRY